MFDTHLHTEYSTDSKMKINEVLDKINEYGIGAIITEHIDLNYRDKSMFNFNIKDYFENYSKYRGEKLLLGVEMGMCNKYSKDYAAISKEYPFDYIIGSLHEMYDTDLYEARELYKSKNKKQLFEEYLEQILSCIETHPFINSLGHIDYIARCADYEDKEIYYEEFADYIDEVLKKLISKGISLELNTRRLGDKKALENLMKIYKRYFQLGGKYVTIGSDAHRPEDIGNNFILGKEFISYCDLKAVYYKKRNMEWV